MKASSYLLVSLTLFSMVISAGCTPSTPTGELPATLLPAKATIASPTAALRAISPTPTAPAVAASPETTANSPNECPGQIPESTITKVRSMVDHGVNVGIVVGIVSPCGSEIYSYGQTVKSGNQAVDGDTVFEIGSISKLFTALLLADMVERGEASFDDPIELYLPSDVTPPMFNGRSITLIDLATHTSGLASLPENFSPADELDPYADYTVEQMYAALSQTTLTREIGSTYEYSNFGMGLLGHTLSLRSGLSFEELVIARITDELGMPDTRITLTPRMQDHLATGYRDGEPFPLWDIPTLAGAGALRSTVCDLLTFLAANTGLIESRLYPAMQVTHEPRYPVNETLQVGLAWHMQVEDEPPIIWVHGATGGYWGFTGFIKDQQISVVILTNTFENIDDIGLSLLEVSAAHP